MIKGLLGCSMLQPVGENDRSVLRGQRFKQGCPLSPVLYVLYVAGLHKHLQQHLVGHGYPCMNARHPVMLMELFYVDDLTIVDTTSPAQLQETLNVVQQFTAAREQLLGPPKCLALMMGRCQPG